MASSAKRRAAAVAADQRRQDDEEEDDLEDDMEDEDIESDDIEDYETEEEEEVHEDVTVDFEAHTMSDGDHDGIKKLLKQLFLKAHVNTTEMANLLIQQNHIGSVIKQAEGMEGSDDDDEEDHVFGFISLLNLTERKDTPCVEEVKELILSRCEESCDQSVAQQLDKILNDNSKAVGLLLSERFINVPAQVALPMYQQLQKELAEAQQTNKPCGKCYYYLIVSKTFTEAAKKPGGAGTQGKDEMMFANAEEEFFYETAILKFNYSVQEESDTQLGGKWSFDDVPMKPMRTVMLVPVDKMNSIMEKFNEHLSV